MFNSRPPVIFAGTGSKYLALDICNYLDLPMGKVDTTPFPNGECQIIINDDVRQRDVFVVLSLSRPNVNDKCMELLLWGDALRRASVARITAVVPYFAYARQDRKSVGRTPISARLLCDLIQVAGFDRVITMDLHASQIQGFFANRVLLDHLDASSLFSKCIKDLVDNGLTNAVVLSPDIGNMKKIDKYRRYFPPEIGMAVIDKRRYSDGRVEPVGIIGDIDGKNIILCDDIISTAGTMRKAIDYSIDRGAASVEGQGFIAIATHGEFVGKAWTNLSHPKIKEIYVTDTISPINDKAKLMKTGKLFAMAINRVHTGRSISALLNQN